jgi:hypothetical protein
MPATNQMGTLDTAQLLDARNIIQICCHVANSLLVLGDDGSNEK